MKKISLAILAVSLLSVTGHAQEFYVRVGLGYAVPQTAQTGYNTPIPYYEYASAYNGTRTYNATSGAQTYNIKAASFSSGVQSVLGLGYMFTPNIGIQLDGGIGLSTTKSTFNDVNVPISLMTTISNAHKFPIQS